MAKSTIKKSATKKSVAKKKTTAKSPVKKITRQKNAPSKSQKTAPASPSNAVNKITLSSVLAINDAKSLHIELGTIMNKKKTLSIDASAVEMVDTAILQLLASFIKKAQSQSIAVTWMKPSKEFLSRSETLNLTGLLGLPEARK